MPQPHAHTSSSLSSTHQHNTISDTDDSDATGPSPELAALDDDFGGTDMTQGGSRRKDLPSPRSAMHTKRSRGSVAVFSALLPFYASPCSAASRWWRIALAPGFVKPPRRIASLPHTR
jgi:hypothetical protein